MLEPQGTESEASPKPVEYDPLLLVGCVVFGATLWFLPPPQGLTAQAWHLFAVFAATIASFIVRPMPMGPCVLVALVVLGVTDTLASPGVNSYEAMLTGFADSTTWLVVAAFLLSAVMIRSGLGKRIALGMISTLGRTTLGLGYAIAGAELVLAPFVPSVTARGGGLMAPIVNALAWTLGSRPDDQPRRAGEYLALCGAHLNLVTAAMFLTGMAANPLVSRAAADVLGIEFGWGRWFLGAIVPGLASLALLPWFLHRLARPELTDSRPAQARARDQLAEMGPWTKPQIVVAAVFVLMLTLWVSRPWHRTWVGLDLSPGLVAVLGVAVLLVTGVERWSHIAGNAAAWDALVWIGGLVTMSEALRESGFVAWFANMVEGLVSGFAPLIAAVALAVVYFYSMYAFSMLTGHIIALAGVFFAVAAGAGTPPLLMVALLAYFSNLCGCTTNYSSGPIVIYFGLGFVPAARWFRIGLIVSLVHLTVWLSVGFAWWKFLGWW